LRQHKPADFAWGNLDKISAAFKGQIMCLRMYLVPLGVAYICQLAIVANITGEVLVEVVHVNMNARIQAHQPNQASQNQLQSK